jgi:integration host factor subunit alpha
MSGKTITRADLCEAIYRKFGLSRTECVRLLELVLKEVTDCLELGETVKLSSFGSFVVRRKGQRMGRNPKRMSFNRSGCPPEARCACPMLTT